ncbi:MAG: DUF898 family protein [Sulfitobacter sp.]
MLHAAAAQTPPPVPQSMQVGFVGSRGALFKLAMITGLYTILTLGFYRFWMKTRMRRWYWSAIRPGGHPMEYVGDPWEKLLGFFIAVVVLTFYIGIVNLLLMFVSFSVFNGNGAGYLASVAGIIPVWFYAQYRARRYVLARTRWRGVRFGLEKGAWGYALRALMHWAITIVSCGILWPRMTFYLEKYKTDRTFFGSARLHQGGRWPMLYRAAIPSMIGAGLIAFAALWMLLDPVLSVSLDEMPGEFIEFLDLLGTGLYDGQLNMPARLFLILPGIALLLYGALHYRYVCKRLLANHKTADGISLHSELSGPRVVGIFSMGSFVSYLMLILGIGAAVMVGAMIFGFALIANNAALDNFPQWLIIALGAAVYLAAFLMWSVLYNAFVTYPLMRHMAATLRLPRCEGLAGVSQRARDEFAEAEGFADALDLGAAI